MRRVPDILLPALAVLGVAGTLLLAVLADADSNRLQRPTPTRAATASPPAMGPDADQNGTVPHAPHAGAIHPDTISTRRSDTAAAQSTGAPPMQGDSATSRGSSHLRVHDSLMRLTNGGSTPTPP